MELVIDGHYLSALTSWGDLDWGLCWPGFSDELTFDVSSHPTVLRPGAPMLLMWAGEALWSGTLDEPVRGQALRGAGLSRLGDHYAALDGGGNMSVVPDTAVPAAIARGLPWTYALGLGAPPIESSTPLTISALIEAQTRLYPGYEWGVSPLGEVIRQAHTPVRFHVRPGGDGLGIAWDNYASTLIARYFNGSTYATVTRTDTGAASRWGYREVTIAEALNDGSTMNSTQAQSILDSMLAAGRSRPGWTTPIEVEFGAVTNDHGQPIALETIRPFEKIRIHGLEDDVTDLAGLSYVDVPIQRIRHNGSKTVITPVGLVSPMQDVLSGKAS